MQYIIANLSVTQTSMKGTKKRVLGGYSVRAERLDKLSQATLGAGPRVPLLIKKSVAGCSHTHGAHNYRPCTHLC